MVRAVPRVLIVINGIDFMEAHSCVGRVRQKVIEQSLSICKQLTKVVKPKRPANPTPFKSCAVLRMYFLLEQWYWCTSVKCHPPLDTPTAGEQRFAFGGGVPQETASGDN